MNIELSILDWIQTLHTPFLDKIMVFIHKTWGCRNYMDCVEHSIASDS